MLWLPSYSDKGGRKKYFVIAALVMAVLFTILMLTHSLWVMIATWFGFGAICPWSWNVGYIWLMELLPKNW